MARFTFAGLLFSWVFILTIARYVMPEWLKIDRCIRGQTSNQLVSHRLGEDQTGTYQPSNAELEPGFATQRRVCVLAQLQ